MASVAHKTGLKFLDSFLNFNFSYIKFSKYNFFYHSKLFLTFQEVSFNYKKFQNNIIFTLPCTYFYTNLHSLSYYF